MDLAIVTEQLSKAYPARRTAGRRGTESTGMAVSQINLAIEEGELFGLLGPNGAGKTTLVKMLCTLISPTSGKAYIAGHGLEDERAIRALSGLVVSDERSFYWRLSAFRNLQFFASLHGLYGSAARQRIATVLAEVGLAERAEQRFSDLSSGMRQRLAIARALLHEPAILFLDEPTRSLDPVATTAVHQLIHTLQEARPITILLITHDLNEAEKLCSRVALMHDGEIRKVGSPHDLRRELDPQRRYVVTVSALPGGAARKLVQQVPGLIIGAAGAAGGQSDLQFQASELENTLSRVLDTVREAGASVVSVEGGPPTLEEVFAHYTAERKQPGQ